MFSSALFCKNEKLFTLGVNFEREPNWAEIEIGCDGKNNSQNQQDDAQGAADNAGEVKHNKEQCQNITDDLIGTTYILFHYFSF